MEDMVSRETTAVFAPMQFYEDFLGADQALPATGTAESGCRLSKLIVGAAPPTVAVVNDLAGGILALALTAANQQQEAVVYGCDQLTWPMNSAVAAGTGGMGLVFEARVRLPVLPAIDAGGDACAFIGMAGAEVNDGVMLNSLHPRMGFRVYGTGAGLVYVETDDATAPSGLVTSGHTITAAETHIFRIDASNPAAIRFYIDGEQVAKTSTVLTMVGAPTASVVLQPYLGVSKTTHEALATMYVDYIRIWANRA